MFKMTGRADAFIHVEGPRSRLQRHYGGGFCICTPRTFITYGASSEAIVTIR